MKTFTFSRLWTIFLFSFLFIIFFPITAQGQVVGDYRSFATANWNTLTTWQRLNTLPNTWATPTAGQGYPGQYTSTANVTFQTGFDVTLNVSPTNSIATLTTQGTGRLINSANNGITLIITGNIILGPGPSPDFDPINMKKSSNDNTIILNGSSQQTISNVSSSPIAYFYNLTISNTSAGGVLLNNKVVIMGNLTVSSNCIYDISTYESNKTSSPISIFTLQSGSKLRLAGTTGGVTGSNFPTWISDTGTLSYSIDPTSTIEYYGYGSTTQTISSSYATGPTPASQNITYGNLLLTNGNATGTATKNLTSNITGIAGNVTIGSGTTFNASSFALCVSGNWSNSGTFTSIGSTINFNGNSNTTIGASNFNNIIISGAGTKSALGTITTSGNFNLTSGQFILNNATSYDITISGNYSQIGGLFDFNYGTSGTCNMYLGGNFTQTTGSGSMTTSGAGAPNGIIIFNGSGIQTMSFANPGGAIWVVYSVPTGKSLKLLSNIGLPSVPQVGFQGEIRVDGTLDMGTATVSQADLGWGGTAVFTVNSGATLITANSSGISGSVIPTNMTTTYSSGANYEFQGATIGTFTTIPTANTVNNLTINSIYNMTLPATPLSTVGNFSLLGLSTVTLAGETTIGGNLSIANGCGISISPAIEMTVNGTITNNAGTSGLVIKSSSSVANGSLIFHNDYLSPVSATVEMYSKAFKDNSAPSNKFKWQFFGIPIRTIVASPTFDGSYVREMHEDDSPLHWSQLNNASTLNSFTGFEITQELPTTVSFQGDLENNDYASGQLSFSTNASYPGQHLIANPYTAAIDISKIVFGNQMLKTVYFYNTGSSVDWAGHSADSSNTSNNNNTPGQYIAVPQAHAGDAGLQHQIPSMQAFLLRAIKDDPNATVSIPYSSANTVVKNTNLQRARASEKVCTIINVKGQSYGDCMWIFSYPYCSHNFDNGWDGEKFFGSAFAPQIFAMEADGNYQVNSVNDMNNTDIGFWAGVDTSYTLTFTNQNFSLQYSNLYLHDLQENTITDITQSGTSYSFSALPTNSPVKRFKILTRPKNTDTSFESPNAENKQLKIFNSQDNIFVHNSSNVSGNLMLYDISGRCIQNKPFIANGVTTIPMNLPAGSYIAKGSTISEELTERLIIR